MYKMHWKKILLALWYIIIQHILYSLCKGKMSLVCHHFLAKRQFIAQESWALEWNFPTCPQGVINPLQIESVLEHQALPAVPDSKRPCCSVKHVKQEHDVVTAKHRVDLYVIWAKSKAIGLTAKIWWIDLDIYSKPEYEFISSSFLY